MSHQPGAPGPQQPGPWSAPGAGKGPPPIPRAPEAPGSSPYAGAYGQGPQYPQGPAMGQYAYGHGQFRPPPPTGQAVAAMVLGILGCVLLASCWGAAIALITSVIGLVLAVKAKRGIARGELGGQSQATAGFVLNIIALVLSALIVLALVLAFTVWQDDLEGSDSAPTYEGRAAAVLLSE
ncbi:DUF4190 domain-containing protein [Streptomyces sulphureus]|uniref:DUF4190 domain-containing protein n=1 Tax=Streptomyces sulphureus TaxID=47758 RepID=UPI000476DB6A|nr:DUF4190 domain-containing protein [Streptomyces sulphureus]